MSVYGIESLLYRLKRDPDLLGQFTDDRTAVLERDDVREIDADEREFILSGDVLSLYRRGIHPLLLVGFSRQVGLDQPTFRDLLAPAVGTRTE
jgi:hypothetical protein